MQTIGPQRNLELRVRRLRKSATLAINERSAQLQSEGKKIYRLGLGQSPFPVPQCVQEALRKNAHQKDYLPVAGLLELRRAVAEFHNRRGDGRGKATQDNVMIGPGSKELLFMAQMAYSGELLLPSPSWVSYEPQAELLGLPTVWVNTTSESGWRMEPEALSQACARDPQRPRMLILNYPNNPAGTSYNREQLESLAGVCREFGILVVSDEIYGEVHHGGTHGSIADYYPEGTIISGGLSKWCGAGGWRLGTFLFPAELDWLREAMCTIASETFTSVSAPIQWAAITAFQGGEEINEYLKASRRVLKVVGSTCHQKLSQAGVIVPEPDGGFYLFCDTSKFRESLGQRGIHDSPALCEQLLSDTGVAVLPGTQFGRAASELTFRMATVNFDGEAALKSAHSCEEPDFMETYCPDLAEAVSLIVGWLNNES